MISANFKGVVPVLIACFKWRLIFSFTNEYVNGDIMHASYFVASMN